MAAEPEIRRLGLDDAEDYRAARLSALLVSPEAFGSSHAVEAAEPIDRFVERLGAAVVFGAYAGGRIVGLAGLKREDSLRDRHKAFVWGVHVEPAFRRQGVGGRLMAAVIGAAHEIVEQLTLAVVADNRDAISLYQRLGFTVYGVEPRALKTADGYADEVLMALILPHGAIGGAPGVSAACTG